MSYNRYRKSQEDFDEFRILKRTPELEMLQKWDVIRSKCPIRYNQIQTNEWLTRHAEEFAFDNHWTYLEFLHLLIRVQEDR